MFCKKKFSMWKVLTPNGNILTTLRRWNLPFNSKGSSFYCSGLKSREVFPGNYSGWFPQEIFPNLLDIFPNLCQYFLTCWKYFPTFSRYFQLVLAQTKKGKIKWPTSLTCSINLSETPRLGRLYLTSGWIVISLIFQGKVKLHKKLLTLINARNKRFFGRCSLTSIPHKRLHY